jgi:hypothetical protein
MRRETNVFAALCTKKFEFSLATEKDDSYLKARMASNVMRGAIEISFRREPSYFAASHIQGEAVDVIQCKSLMSQSVVGLSCRSKTRLNIDGASELVGYLADLRGDPSVRGGTLLARGIQALQILQQRDSLEHHFCVLYEGNDSVEKLLTSKRVGLPNFDRLDRVLTPAIMLGRKKKPIQIDGTVIRRGCDQDLPKIAAFLQQEFSEKNFSPCISVDELRHGKYRSICAKDYCLLIAKHDGASEGEILACLAMWNQSAFRQTYVEGYNRMLQFAKPLINALVIAQRGLPFVGTPLKRLPNVGEVLPFVYIALVASRSNDLGNFSALLRYAYNELCNSGFHYMVTSLCESDRLNQATKNYRSIAAAGVLYAVRFAEQNKNHAAADGKKRVNYVEAGCL